MAPPRTGVREFHARAGWFAALLLLWGACYFGIGGSGLARRARDVAAPLDAAVPFLGWTVWIYLAGLLLIIAPLFMLRDLGQFRITARCYALAILASLACFATLPSSSASLRAAVAVSELPLLTAWAVRALQDIDPPVNLFPSLHVSLSALAAWSIAEATPRWRQVWRLALALVAISVVTAKQHTLLDVGGGLALAAAARSTARGRPAFRHDEWATFAALAAVFALFCLIWWRARELPGLSLDAAGPSAGIAAVLHGNTPANFTARPSCPALLARASCPAAG
jgi:membrane-associated phospholipid phosphatase